MPGHVPTLTGAWRPIKPRVRRQGAWPYSPTALVYIKNKVKIDARGKICFSAALEYRTSGHAACKGQVVTLPVYPTLPVYRHLSRCVCVYE